MRYFTDDLWSKINSTSQKERDEAIFEWNINDKEYSKKFLKTYLFNHGFHDFELKNIELKHKKYGYYKHPISVDIYVTDDIDTYKITYKCIKKFNVSFEEIEQGWSGRRGFDTWGYSEFLPVNEQTLSHEILFASGSTILVHFKNNNIFIEKIQ
jgi:hypothetical protein